MAKKKKTLDLTLPIFQIKISLRTPRPSHLAAGADGRLFPG